MIQRQEKRKMMYYTGNLFKRYKRRKNRGTARKESKRKEQGKK